VKLDGLDIVDVEFKSIGKWKSRLFLEVKP